ncbi:hypothetical protein BT93_E2249 [Corymbia citriodora subsp. variegata]|nr:hypothetical protein BT93_E2249 [Corymbia citriodora subsp. variegata]
MHKQWADAMNIFHEKFDLLTSLINDHGLDSSPQEEFLSLLGGARSSPAVHQFLVNSLGEVIRLAFLSFGVTIGLLFLIL